MHIYIYIYIYSNTTCHNYMCEHNRKVASQNTIRLFQNLKFIVKF